jgi:hypothetical protein
LDLSPLAAILPRSRVPNPRKWVSANPEGGFLLAPLNLWFPKSGYTAALGKRTSNGCLYDVWAEKSEIDGRADGALTAGFTCAAMLVIFPDRSSSNHSLALAISGATVAPLVAKADGKFSKIPLPGSPSKPSKALRVLKAHWVYVLEQFFASVERTRLSSDPNIDEELERRPNDLQD